MWLTISSATSHPLPGRRSTISTSSVPSPKPRARAGASRGQLAASHHRESQTLLLHQQICMTILLYEHLFRAIEFAYLITFHIHSQRPTQNYLSPCHATALTSAAASVAQQARLWDNEETSKTCKIMDMMDTYLVPTKRTYNVSCHIL